MNTRHFNVRSILAGEAPKDVAIKVKGWVRTRRDSKAGISFIHLSDGSSLHPVQVVAPNTLSNYTETARGPQRISTRRSGAAGGAEADCRGVRRQDDHAE